MPPTPAPELPPARAPEPAATLVLLVRHGLVENPGGVLYGRLPGFSLSAAGRAQAEAAAARLAGVPVGAIRCSPMERARETAAIIASRHPGVPVEVDERLHEVHWVREGMAGADFARLRLRVYDADAMVEGDESIEAIAKRMRAFLLDQACRPGDGPSRADGAARRPRRDLAATIRADSGDDRQQCGAAGEPGGEAHGELSGAFAGVVVAVSHGDPIAVARALAAGRPLTVADFERDYPPPASITPIAVGASGTLRLVPADAAIGAPGAPRTT